MQRVLLRRRPEPTRQVLLPEQHRWQPRLQLQEPKRPVRMPERPLPRTAGKSL
jgi:hypothetical protein